MRLTALLFRKDRLPNGHIFRGKDRLVRKVVPVDLRRLQESYEIEEKNMSYLKHPYLSEEQSFGHSKALGKQAAYIKRFEVESQSRFKLHVTLADRLSHLKVRESWD